MEALNLSAYSSFSNKRSLAKKVFKSLSVFALICSISFSATGQNRSLDFSSATTNYVTLPNIIPTGNYSKEAWINIRSIGAFNTIIAGVLSDFYITGGFLEGFHNGNLGAVSESATFPAVPTLTLGIWYHVAVTYNATTNIMTIYRNGVQTATGTPDAAAYAELEQYIGTYNNGGGPGVAIFDGQMDEVRIWNFERTAAQILASYNTGLGCLLSGDEPGLLAYYHFDQGTAGGSNPTETTLFDATDRCVPNNGTLFNFTLSGGTSNWVAANAGVTTACPETFPNANLVGNGNCIADDDVSPSLTDHTNFGNGPVLVRTFTIQNTGTANLTTASVALSGPNAGEFAISGFTPGIIAPAGSTTFTVTFTAVGTGAKTATVTVTSDDLDEGTYVFDILAANTALPVELKSFTARKSGSQSQLNWVTVTEIYNRGFEIQRSADGTNWSVIGFVPGAANSSSELSYSFVDPTPQKGRNSYRLRQVDLDNRSKYSEVRAVTFASETTIVYPVPTSDKITIELKDSKMIGTVATLSDQQGKIVKRFTISAMQQQVSLAAMPDGVYILKLDDGTSHKLVKQ